MPRPLRMFTPQAVYFVTNRTIQGRLLLAPSARVNNLIGGVLACAVERYCVKLHAFVFSSNHFHLIVGADNGAALSAFVGYLEGNIAREVGRHVHWRGPFWERRYSAEPILDDDALMGRLKYIFAHGPKEGLVDRAEMWPGLTCIPELVHGLRRRFPRFNRSAQYWARLRGEPHDDARFMASHGLALVPPPSWERLAPSSVRDLAARVLADANAEARASRGDKPSLGVAAVCAQDPWSAPTGVKRAPRPICHASTAFARKAFLRARREFCEAYRVASALFRAGNLTTPFPEGSFRPPVLFSWPRKNLVASGAASP